jgi:hypothetical protein
MENGGAFIGAAGCAQGFAASLIRPDHCGWADLWVMG